MGFKKADNNRKIFRGNKQESHLDYLRIKQDEYIYTIYMYIYIYTIYYISYIYIYINVYIYIYIHILQRHNLV